MKKRNFSLCALLLCAVLLSALSGCDVHAHTFRQTVIEPTCNSIGYTVNTCACGETYYSDYLPETEHTFGDWITEQAATLIAGGEEYRTCALCGLLQTRDVENLSALPKLYLDGAADGKETIALRYTAGKETGFSCDALLTQQTDPDGGKHLYELQLLIGSGEQPIGFADSEWGEQDRYLLSPQTLDPTYTRTLAAQALWNACLSRQAESGETPEWAASALKSYVSINRSIVLQLYRDGAYVGLYLLSLPRDVRIGGEDSAGAALRAEDESNGCLFREKPSYTEDGSEGFSFLADSDANAAWATDSFTAFAEFVHRSRDAAFREQLSQYTDPEVLMDYYLLLQFFGAPYGDTVGTVWYTTDLDHWLPTFDSYQLSYGLKANGTPLGGAVGIPVPDEDGNVSYPGQSLLWERLIQLFPEELTRRYRTLQQTVLQPDALYEAFLAQYEQIEPGLFEEEAALSTAIEGAGDTERIRTYLFARMIAMDGWIQALEGPTAVS